MDSNTPKLSLRTIEAKDYPQLAELMDLVFPDVGGAWPRITIMDLIHQFPDGQICIVDNDKIVGAALTIKVDYNRFSLPHIYTDIITEQNVIQNQPSGDAMYGLDVFVHPDYRGLRLGRRFMMHVKSCVEIRTSKRFLLADVSPAITSTLMNSQ